MILLHSMRLKVELNNHYNPIKPDPLNGMHTFLVNKLNKLSGDTSTFRKILNMSPQCLFIYVSYFSIHFIYIYTHLE